MLRLESITKRFDDFSLEAVSLTVNRGDYFVLLGASGAGKSVLLETIAGLVIPDSGTIHLNGIDITGARIQRRGVGLVFQDHAVFPHMNVEENLMYPLHGVPGDRRAKRALVSQMAAGLGIGSLLSRRPNTLSGGELQRIALGRTLIQEPSVLLLDEPLSSVDTGLKTELRRLLRQIHAKGQTILHVTHDYEEALSLATKIAVIHEGRIVQCGTPQEVFHYPANAFVANFTGVRNFFPASLFTSDLGTFARLKDGKTIRIGTGQTDGEGFVLIRGEDILLSRSIIESSAANHFAGVILEIVPTRGGADAVIDAGIEFHAIVTHESVNQLGLAAGSSCHLYFKASAVRFIPK